MINPQIILKGKYSPEDIEIRISPKSNRKINPRLERRIKKHWAKVYAEAKKEGKLIYNGTSYRLDSFRAQGKKLILNVSTLKFCERIGLRDFQDELEKLGEDYYGKGLGIGGFILTSDDYYVFGERNGKTMSRSQFDFIGGLLDTKEEFNGRELFNANFHEIKEEINVSRKSILDMFVAGMLLSPTTTVLIVTQTKLNITKKDVVVLFAKARDDEMKDLVFVHKDEIKEFLKRMGPKRKITAQLLDE